MFPEDDLCEEFWLFIRRRATEANDSSAGTVKLNSVEVHRNVVRWYLRGQPDRGPDHEIHDANDINVAYDSLQDALLAFLVYKVSSSGFPYDYDTWLRTTSRVFAAALRDPSLLTLTVPVDEEGVWAGPPVSQPTQEQEHTMRISDNWDCLNRDTFKTICRIYSGTG